MTPVERSAGGLAVALGIAAAAIALAGPASAAPGGASADDSAHDRRGRQAHSVDRSDVNAMPSSARQISPRPSIAGTDGAGAASTASEATASDVARAAASIRVSRRPVRTAVAASVVAVPANTVPANTVPANTVPANTVPANTVLTKTVPVARQPVATGMPTAASRPYPRWDSRGRLITIYKGTHFVIPNRWALWITKDSGDATFTADSAYDLKDEDQYDWNKLAGITFTPWRPDRNSSMVVWRYNLHNGMYEIGPFFNVDFAYVFPTADQIITVPADQTFSYSVDYNGITVSYGDRTVYKPTPGNLTPNFWTSARVTGWFGGSEVAPRTVSYYQRLT